MKPIEGVHFIQGDFLHETTRKRIMDACRGAAPDILMSDMAPNLSGHHDMDHIKSVELVREALRLARAILAPGKSTVFLAKVFQGRLLQGILYRRVCIVTFVARSTRRGEKIIPRRDPAEA